jgi:NAD(P)-dependent dehydrogenase (short-subunit alcohol dehydrogenase family)
MNKPLCIIVGMASRIGLAVAKRFASEGHTIAMIGKTKFLLEKYATKLKEMGYDDLHAFIAPGDSLGSLENAFKEIHEKLGPADVLVYNESVIAVGHASEITGDSILEDLRINVAGALVSANMVIPQMKERGKGTILFTGGEFATDPDPEYASAAIGHAANRNLCFTLARELEPHGIHVATVTVHGLAKVQTVFDPVGVKFEPDVIADKFFELYTQPVGEFETEVIYK